jgi:leader peptidase (prepilin peptidase)/N-methyltransferase
VTAAMPAGLPPVLAWPALVALAAVLGSFLNVCISRLPRGESIVSPPSHCPRCVTPIRWFDNIPLVSFAILGGRCRACRKPISWRYPLVEALAVGIGLLVFVRHGLTWEGLSAFVLSLLLLVVAFTDLETLLIPNRITLPGIVLGLALRLYPAPRGVLEGALGALVAGGIFYVIMRVSPLVFGREGMGFGDVKLAAMMGAFLGFPVVLVAVFLGVVAGGVTAIVLLLLGLRRLGEYLPFGTFLAAGGVLGALWGRPLLAWYLR